MMMTPLAWIVVLGLAMSAISLVGALTLVLKESLIEKLLLPLVAFSAGALIGGALFHMLPLAVGQMHNSFAVYIWVAIGFVTFLILEQILGWHHCHKTVSKHTHPLTYLLLIADGLHNFICGLAVGAALLTDIRVGITAWIVAAAHEIPQELGDFGVMIHGGWSKRRALWYNLLSSLTFLVGGLLAYLMSEQVDTTVLVAFAAGNFLYIGAVDLIPEIKPSTADRKVVLHTLSFIVGLALLLVVGALETHHHHG